MCMCKDSSIGTRHQLFGAIYYIICNYAFVCTH